MDESVAGDQRLGKDLQEAVQVWSSAVPELEVCNASVRVPCNTMSGHVQAGHHVHMQQANLGCGGGVKQAGGMWLHSSLTSASTLSVSLPFFEAFTSNASYMAPSRRAPSFLWTCKAVVALPRRC